MAYHLICLVLILNWASHSSEAFGTYGFDIHHRYSDSVKGVLDLDDLPEKGTHDYYTAMAYRDRLSHGRRLAADLNSSILTFSGGNDTYRINSLGFLHYANVTVGTPGLSFLVALDTGSDLFWLPCDCGNNCIHALKTRSAQIDLNIYSPNISSTSSSVPCNSTMCKQRTQCSAPTSACPYQRIYLSNNTSSTGTLVEDVLHLVTDDTDIKMVQAPIKFGCGKIQTGSFLDGAAPNGLFGLGMQDISVPSMLASQGLASNSFSMCFGLDGIGRIRFGDKGASDQEETPFNLEAAHPTYNISVTQISVGGNVTDLNFTAVFDSGTLFTYLNDPAYSAITESFDTQVVDKRLLTNSDFPFEYCYNISGNETQDGGYVYCLAVIKSNNINIIGQNFMTGYNIVFDREKRVLGWKASDCYDGIETNYTSLISPNPSNTATPPMVNPEATAVDRIGFPLLSPAAPPPTSHGNQSSSLTCAILMAVFAFFYQYYMVHPSN